MVGMLVLATLLAQSDVSKDVPATAVESAAPKPVATPKEPLREIGHVRAASRFCSAFETHFNGAVRPLLESDANVGFIGFSLGDIEPSFNVMAGELRFYDDRVNMMHYNGELQKLIPQAQREVDELRRSAKLATDPDTALQTFELARQLQKALDKQRQLAIDTLSVVQAMGEFTTAKTKTELKPGLPGSYDTFEDLAPADMRDVRSYLRWQKQLDRISDAEGAAAERADTISQRCL